MKKILEIVKPYIAIIFGALILLCYMNALAGEGFNLALGIIATVLGAYYLGVGIVGLILGDKLPANARGIFDVVSAGLYPVFMFLQFLFTVITGAEYMGPTGWIIHVTALAVSITLGALLVVIYFVRAGFLKKLVELLASIFVLVLLANLLFSFVGNPRVL